MGGRDGHCSVKPWESRLGRSWKIQFGLDTWVFKSWRCWDRAALGQVSKAGELEPNFITGGRTTLVGLYLWDLLPESGHVAAFHIAGSANQKHNTLNFTSYWGISQQERKLIICAVQVLSLRWLTWKWVLLSCCTLLRRYSYQKGSALEGCVNGQLWAGGAKPGDSERECGSGCGSEDAVGTMALNICTNNLIFKLWSMLFPEFKFQTV